MPAFAGMTKEQRAFSMEFNEGRLAAALFPFYACRMRIDDEQPEEIDSAHLPDVLEGLAQARRGEFVSDAEIEAVFRRFDSP